MAGLIHTGGVLALDLSSVVGWCYGRIGDVLPLFGTWHLSKHPQLGARFVAFENELIRAMELYRPAICVMEAPLIASRQGSDRVARQQIGLAAYTEGESYRHGVECLEQASNTVRKAVMGRGTYSSSEAAKEAVMFWTRRMGWIVPDHNAGDACVLWQYMCDKRRVNSRGR